MASIPLLTEAELQSATIDPVTGELYWTRADGTKIIAGVASGASDAQVASLLASGPLTGTQLSAAIDGSVLPLRDQTAVAARRAGSFLRGVPAANEQFHYTSQFGSVPSANSVKRHQTFKSGPQLMRLVFGNNFAVETNLNAVPIVVRASVDNGSVRSPVFFRGSRDATIEVGAYVVSDPVVINVASDKFFWQRVFVTASDSLHIPYVGSPSTTISAWGEGCDATNNVSQTDKTMTGGPTPTGGLSWYGACAIITEDEGQTPYVSLNGDSVLVGVGDTNGQATGVGFGRRAMNNEIPYAMQAVIGASMTHGRDRRRILLGGETGALCEFGVNDVSGNTVAQLKANYIAEWTFHRAIGATAVYQTTMMPRTSSTDNWATEANQSVDSNSPKRIEINDWIRAGAPMVAGVGVVPGTSGAIVAGDQGHPLSGYFEVADTVETARNSGKWKVGMVYTTDGLGVHPNAAGHAAAAAAIDIDVFR
ncbi:hypothetical protein [Microbacterium terrisoli]|uniref:hypothetical protein n=1 Tax=Microbacterium terrisoli TaxID=3242192 RepID=UPI0028038919|nr:hypothetical protein [Microbacterium protaetiae]